MTEDELFNLSEEELQEAFNKAKSELASGEFQAETAEDEGMESQEYDEYEDDEVEEDFSEEEEEEEDESDMEQPDSNEDSEDDDTSESTDGDEEESEEASTEQTEADATEAKSDDEQPAQPTKIAVKANGREYEFTEDEIRAQFPKVFGQAMDYTKKMQAIKPWRKTIDAIESANLGHDDVSLMIDVLKGDKSAIAEVIKRTGVNALELDTDVSNYVAKDYGRDEIALNIKDVIEEIRVDKEYETTHRILEKEWDDDSWAVLSRKPNMIKGLHYDVKSGLYDKLMPTVEKLKLYDGGSKSDLDYYGIASSMYFDNIKKAEEAEQARLLQLKSKEIEQAKAREIAEVKTQRAKVEDTKAQAPKRKAAAPVRKGAGSKQKVDYLSDSEEGFEEWYQDIQSRM